MAITITFQILSPSRSPSYSDGTFAIVKLGPQIFMSALGTTVMTRLVEYGMISGVFIRIAARSLKPKSRRLRNDWSRPASWW